MDDYTAKDHGAIDVLAAGYSDKVSVIVSKFKDASAPNRTMAYFIERAGDSYDKVRREPITNRMGVKIGELVVLKSNDPKVHSTPGYGTPEYLMATRGVFLYRVYSYAKYGNGQELYSALPAE